jgi:hypothetical protein
MKYKNLARAEAQDAELEALEAEYRKQQGDPGPEPVAREEDPVQNVLTQEEETWKQRYGNLKSFSDKRYNELVQKVSALEQANALASKRPAELPRNVDEMREWVKTYPDLAGVIKAMIAEDVDYMREQISPQLQELEDVKYELVRQKAYAAVVRAHNDFPELLNDQEFIEWVNRQPEEKGPIGQSIYDALNGVDYDAAIKALNIYKQEQNFKKPAKRQPNTAAREAVQQVTTRSTNEVPSSTGGKRTWAESQVENMSIRDYEKFEDDIDAAKREGRFVYDLSGAAR